MEDILGGLLADDMGLGKTLSVLAVIVASLSRAFDFAFAKTRAAPSHWEHNVPSKTTLVIVPSSRKFIIDRYKFASHAGSSYG